MKRILVGISGGIDSAVSVLLLQEQGFRVVGVTFKFLDDELQIEETRKLADTLKIEHFVIDKQAEFKKRVIDYFVSEYLLGKTPFPCVVCNLELKWKSILELANELDIKKVAMGHYANITYKNGCYFIKEGADKNKDQSFFLWHLKQAELKKIVFPLGQLTKTDVKAIAKRNDIKELITKKESVGACFCQKDYRQFLLEQLGHDNASFRKGNFVSETGEILGYHKGYPFFTVGQRRGFGLQANRALYVKEIRPKTNEVVLAEHNRMFQREFYISNYNLVNPKLFSDEFDTFTRIRYRKQNSVSRIKIISKDLIKIELQEPLDAIAPGQTAVFYRNEKVLGGGFIV